MGAKYDRVLQERDEARASAAAWKSAAKMHRETITYLEGCNCDLDKMLDVAKQERDALQAEVDEMKAELADESDPGDISMPPRKVTRGRFVADDSPRCETCRHRMQGWTDFRNRTEGDAGSLCTHSSASLCAPNGFSEWEAKDEN